MLDSLSKSIANLKAHNKPSLMPIEEYESLIETEKKLEEMAQVVKAKSI